MLSLLFLVGTALAQSSVDPSAAATNALEPAAAASSASDSTASSAIVPPGPNNNRPFNHGPQGQFHFLSPALVYSPSDGWSTDMLTATSNVSSNASVSLQTVASGVVWRFARTNVSLLVNGSDPATFNATAVVTDTNATISGLEYGWYNFTLTTNGTGSVNGVTPVVNGSQWLPARDGPMTAVNATANPLYSTFGNWTGESGLSTRTPGSGLVIRAPLGTALLEVTQDIPAAPAAAYNVSVSPAPPRQPATQSFTGTIRSADIVATIGILNVIVYRVELDPRQNYTVNVTYADDGTRPFHINNIGAYEAREAEVLNSTAEERHQISRADSVGVPLASVITLLLAIVYFGFL